ncbi:hypothetical protein pv_290 [Pithovirus sibericum]|uniref:Uncharacterized protein n=1 Tax=Pithovirus sibericum TaxID=1450746 RepID=W5S698_9VIRU|nr:hypothetical protein pv_290 [Pithovirus sibericum]AHH01857.1 hypothetical protein pv_290 [Pithovirus sibericum]WIL05438.1 hypothetical protein pmam_399 [Pithovirus mammoth]
MQTIFSEEFNIGNPSIKTCNLLLLGDPETGKKFLHENYIRTIHKNRLSFTIEKDSAFQELDSFTKRVCFGRANTVRVHQISDPTVDAFQDLVNSADGIFIFFESSNLETFQHVASWFNRVKEVRPYFDKISFVEMNFTGIETEDSAIESLFTETRFQYPLFRISISKFSKDAEKLYQTFIVNL